MKKQPVLSSKGKQHVKPNTRTSSPANGKGLPTATSLPVTVTQSSNKRRRPASLQSSPVEGRLGGIRNQHGGSTSGTASNGVIDGGSKTCINVVESENKLGDRCPSQ
ncbi:hypothetical protein PIB30_014241 [Stylosanthes scabra]|uniref:Uncharacterized protein n=1 Tax=Stylosanthes scabra TaxID=79078 RepID=A0ABU6X4X2_9FABA|nr:hypothetical protein [Stylosanthes scabra]